MSTIYAESPFDPVEGSLFLVEKPTPKVCGSSRIYRALIGSASLLGVGACAVAKYVNYIHFKNNPVIGVSSSLLLGGFLQGACEIIHTKTRKTINEFKARWSLEIFEVNTQIQLNLPVGNGAQIAREFLMTSQVALGSALTVQRSVMYAKQKLSDIPIKRRAWAVYDKIRMVEPDWDSFTSTVFTQIAKGAVGTGCLTLHYFYSDLTFLPPIGYTLLGMTVGTVAHKIFSWQKERMESARQKLLEATAYPVPVSLPLKVVRVSGKVCHVLSRNGWGALFAADGPGFYLSLGALMGAGKSAEQKDFEEGPVFTLSKEREAEPLWMKGTKVAALTAATGYLSYLMVAVSNEARIGLLSFTIAAPLSYGLTYLVEKKFESHESSRYLASLYFYLHRYPDYLPLLFLFITKKIKIGDIALNHDDLKRLIVSCAGWASLGASMGNNRARLASLYADEKTWINQPVTNALTAELIATIYKKNL